SPGFKALHIIKKVGDELYYAGDEVLGIAADTEEHALDALHAVKIEYTPLAFAVTEEDALRKKTLETVPPIGPKKERQNVRPPLIGESGDFGAGVMKADVTVEGTYGVPAISHQCLESHGLVAEWGADGGLTVWASTQAVDGTAKALGNYFRG